MQYFKKIGTSEFQYNFDSLPIPFDKELPLETLKYAVGANLYTPATRKNLSEVILHKIQNTVGAVTMCLEDAIRDYEVEEGEDNVITALDKIYEECFVSDNVPNMQYWNLPLLFVRVRSIDEFKRLSSRLTKKRLQLLCGFVFPKFNSTNGDEYFKILKELAKNFDEILYGMPIIESKEAIYIETRTEELIKIKEILNANKQFVLNVRVGATDISSLYGLRRTVNQTIYDIRVVSNCLADIQNIFSKNTDYIVSGPVWEYYNINPDSEEIEGLKKELRLDISNGFFGKTIIHPSQIDVVNKEYIVKYEDYMDALNILKSNDGGVFGSENKNRMNESKPHTLWAKSIMNRARIFGVMSKEICDKNLPLHKVLLKK